MPGSDAGSMIERGRVLFNLGSYFEAHEAWEEAWLAARGERRLRLQGLIQIAAALHKAKTGDSPGGCARLLDAGLEKLGPAPTFEGLALTDFRAAIAAFRQGAESWLIGEERELPSAAFPILERSR